MKTVFIADAHLVGLDDPNRKTLCAFLATLDGVERLVVLGDLFEFWTGNNDVVYRNYLPVLESLLELKTKGTEIIYLEGNHDFFMGPFFTDELGASVYEDAFVLELDGKKYLLAHGDIAAANLRYAAWRAFLRSFLFRALKRVLPPSVVWRTAMWLSKSSRTYHEARGRGIERRFRTFVKTKIADGVDGVILAHSHVSGVQEVDIEGRKGLYVNPGSWMDGTYVVYEEGAFRVEKYEG